MFNYFCRLIIFIVVGIFLFNSSANAEMQTFSGVGEYTMTEYELAGNAKQRAKFYAVRDAQSQAGIYIKSYSQAKNLVLEKDEIIAISAGIVQIIETKITSIPIGDSVKFHAEVKVNIDIANVDEWLKRDPKERENLIKQNQELEKSIAEQEEQIKHLKNLIAEAKTPEDIEKIKAGFAEIDREFLANLKIEEGIQFRAVKDYSNSLASFNKAAELSPNNFLVYFNRGGLYSDLQQYNLAVDDYKKSIYLKPNNPGIYVIYNNLGNIYSKLKNYRQAVEYYTKAIAIYSKVAPTYCNRGSAYLKLEDYDRAIRDFYSALDLLQSGAEVAYKTYEKLDREQIYEALSDAYLNRGIEYANNRQYEKAIADFTKAIEFTPNEGLIYNNRGVCYEALGNTRQAQSDYQKANVLGYKS